MNKTVTIIDTFGFFFRSFYALPQHLKNKDGFPTGLLTGFTNFISTLQKQHDSDYRPRCERRWTMAQRQDPR